MATSVGMNELHVTLGDRKYSFGPGETVRIGRSPDNDIVVGDPTVSRMHAQFRLGPDGWEFENVGRALSFLDGQPVSRALLSGPAHIQLSSAQGPVLGITPGDRPAVPDGPDGAGTGDAASGDAGPDSTGPDNAAPDSTAPDSSAPDSTDEFGAVSYPDLGQPAAEYPDAEAPRIRPVQVQPVDEIATALHILVPIRSWLHDPGWRQFLRLLVIPYGLLPLVFIALFASSGNLATPGWAYSLYIAPLWAIVFWLLIRPGQVGRQEALIGAGAIAFALLWIRIVTIHINELMGKSGKPLPFLGAIGVGFNEEITKALPILLAAMLLLKLRSTKLDVRMWMFLGAVVGLAFGVTEQAGYTLQDIQGIASAQANNQAIVEVLAFAERVFVDGFQHAIWAGVSAFFIGMAVNYPRRRLQLIAFGIAIPAVLHGLYDWSAGAFASLWVPIIIQAISLFLFLGYTMSAAAIERQVRQTPMFRGESMLMERILDRGDG
jgi:RsiW-degrading membrane proteinase PrsW (M82 family)